MPIKYSHNRFGIEFPIRKVRIVPAPTPVPVPPPIIRPPEMPRT